MRFLFDQSTDRRLVSYLRGQGHDVTIVASDHPASLPDVEVLAIARHEQRILVTEDRDFGELVFHHHEPHTGVLYLRLSAMELEQKIARLAYALERHASEMGHFLVVTRARVRVREARHQSGL